MDNFMRCLVVLILMHMTFMAARTEYVCRPYQPTQECEDGRYELRIYSMGMDDGKPRPFFVALGQARCVKRVGVRLAVEDLNLSAHLVGVWHKPEFYEDQQLTARHTEVCRVE